MVVATEIRDPSLGTSSMAANNSIKHTPRLDGSVERAGSPDLVPPVAVVAGFMRCKGGRTTMDWDAPALTSFVADLSFRHLCCYGAGIAGNAFAFVLFVSPL
ncbi:sugars will eventually be exported transporter2 [Zea mays]|uniref:Sugars will eventually be exported transporter2 n=1 Tax=Zea mays TaxID=4577 RepID=A0A1D6FJ45_MAIZE|nr:sugars will eventually be exported transporter2 [Zea mays]